MSVHQFFSTLAFEPDSFQVVAAEAVERGQSVVVTAPTGAGKTLVAEAAVDHYLKAGRRLVLYDTAQGPVEPEVSRFRPRRTERRTSVS